MHRADSPAGPWTPAPKRVGLGGCNNPAPAFHPNGSFFLVCHNNGLQLFRSDNGTKGPFVRIVGKNSTYNAAGGNIQPTRFIGMDGAEGYVNKATWEDPDLHIDAAG